MNAGGSRTLCVIAIVGVNHLCSNSTGKPFPSEEVCDKVTEEEQGTKVSLADNRSLTETMENQDLD